MKWAGIEKKVSFCQYCCSRTYKLQLGHITLDNAENNAVAMKELEQLLVKEKITFDAKDNRIPCHIPCWEVTLWQFELYI